MEFGKRESQNVLVVPLDAGAPMSSAVRAFAGRREPAILETARQNRFSRFSILACDPIKTLESDCPNESAIDRLWEAAASVTRPSRTGGRGLGVGVDRRETASTGAGRAVPFAGGWIGFLAYEAGLHQERIGARTDVGIGVPLMRFGLYDSAAVFDHAHKRWYAVAVDWDESPSGSHYGAVERIAIIRDLLDEAEALGRYSAPPPSPGMGAISANLSADEYAERFGRIQDYIASGDVYQVNLTIEFRARTEAAPLDLYLLLRESSPAPYAAFLSWGDRAIISSSPELFLSLSDGRVVTRPIKGTRPRSADPIIDDIYRHELQVSEKDQAELNMIVDLLRNDLGRTCEFGTVGVQSPGDIEDHPNVFHRVATIEGRLRRGTTWRDLLRSTFPGGSVTGAPKIRAMQVIAELESAPRGVYCGAIGWIGLDGSLEMNLAIRTMTKIGHEVRFSAGGGIVADSVCEDEYDEVLAKLKGMKSALCGVESPAQPRQGETPQQRQPKLVGW